VAIKFPWSRTNTHRDDPYWDFFINRPPADLANTVTEMIRSAPAGNVFPTKTELHTPAITASHVKGMAKYFGAEMTGIVKLETFSPRPLQPVADPPSAAAGETLSSSALARAGETSSSSPLPRAGESKGEGPTSDFPFAILCAVHADDDPRRSPGIGGQVPVQNGLFITFVLSSWIRELGYRATIVRDVDSDALAAKAKLGTLNSQGRLVTEKFGGKVYVADAIYTDLPLAADG
jgi:hypothetical protein